MSKYDNVFSQFFIKVVRKNPIMRKYDYMVKNSNLLYDTQKYKKAEDSCPLKDHLTT
jgi:hypothetical protein